MTDIQRTITSAVVTGPTGAIGIALCKKLLAEGVSVYAVCRPGSTRTKALVRHLEADRQGGSGAMLQIVECDLSQLLHLPEKQISCDAFFHLGWMGTVGAGRDDMDAQIRNIQFTLDAVRTARQLGCKMFIGAGSQAEYGYRGHALAPDSPAFSGINHVLPPDTPAFSGINHALAPNTPAFPETGYGMAKLCAGQMSRAECHKLGMAHIWPRILSVYGPGSDPGSMISIVIQKLLHGEKPSLTAGEQQWDYLYSQDAAEALYRMSVRGRDGAVYPLGSGIARPLREYIEILRDQIDPALSLGFGEVPYSPKQIMYLRADITSLRKDTGFEPKVSFEDGIRMTIQEEKQFIEKG